MPESVAVLMIEDNVMDAELCRHYLQQFDGVSYEVDSCELFADACRHIAENDYDVIILDMNLPDARGIDLFKKIYQQAESIPIIISTGVDDDALAIEAMRLGAQDYLVKSDIAKGTLLRSIRYAMERKAIERQLKLTAVELQKANQTMLAQQKSVIEEERLQLMLQMAGATAHQMNQPLAALLGSIDLIQLHMNKPEKLKEDLERIKNASERMRDIVRNLQRVRRDEVVPYVDNASIINFDQTVRILSVMDSNKLNDKTQRMLSKLQNYSLIAADDMRAAVEQLKKTAFDLVLLEFELPDGDGFDFFEKLKSASIDVPVIVITGQCDEVIGSKVIQIGAADYMAQDDITAEALERSVMSVLEKNRLKLEIKRATARMAKMALRDEITGLLNIKYFTEALQREVARARRYNANLSVCLVQLDGFRTLQESHGDTASTTILTEAARLIEQCIRQSDQVCRYGGSEFALLLPSTGAEEARAVCERYREMMLGYPFGLSGTECTVSISAGVAETGIGTDDCYSDDLVARAVKALDVARKKGGNRVIVYSSDSCCQGLLV